VGHTRPNDLTWAARLIDARNARTPPCLPTDGVEPALRGDFRKDDWCDVRTLPSPVTETDLNDLEALVGAQFPSPVRAFLGARCHCMDQLHARSHRNQLVLWHMQQPSDPLAEVRAFLKAHRDFSGVGFVPIAQWGDGWGPMCFDALAPRDSDEDAVVGWFDHERFTPEFAFSRAAVEPLFKPLYPSTRAFFRDAFED
jgi:hypothetical protein